MGTEQSALDLSGLKRAVETVSVALMMTDRDRRVTFVNEAIRRILRQREEELRRHFPGFSAEGIVGSRFDPFQWCSEHQRALSSDPLNLPHKARIEVGPLVFDLVVSPIYDEYGAFTGTTVEWRDITDQVEAEAALDTLIDVASTTQVASNSVGDFAVLNRSIDNHQDLVGQIGSSATALSRSAVEISAGNANLSARTQEQAAAIEQTAATVEQLTQTVKQNAENARHADQLASSAREVASSGGKVVNRAVQAMSEINRSSKRIADIIGVIDEIAFQTNLLALNAAVEAARAGDQGRGFAVVATEVRNLAQRSANAAREIKTLIKDSLDKVEDGTKLVDRSGSTLDEIVAGVKKVSDIVAEIAAATDEQATGIDQVNRAISQMDETTQQNAALVEKAATLGSAMNKQTQRLQSLVHNFEVDTSGPAPKVAPPSTLGVESATKTSLPPVCTTTTVELGKSLPVMEPTPVVPGVPYNEDEWQEF